MRNTDADESDNCALWAYNATLERGRDLEHLQQRC